MNAPKPKDPYLESNDHEVKYLRGTCFLNGANLSNEKALIYGSKSKFTHFFNISPLI